MFGIRPFKARYVAYVASTLGLAASLWTLKAYASGACNNCLITGLSYAPDGKVVVQTSLDMAGPCAGKTGMWFDSTTAKGKTLLSLTQSAFLAGKRVNMNGNNVCTAVVTTTLEELNILAVLR
jgi:hypothetical protein